MAVTLRQLKIASTAVKILFCLLLWGGCLFIRNQRGNWARTELEKLEGSIDPGGIGRKGKPWRHPDKIGNENHEIRPGSFMVRHLLQDDVGDQYSTTVPDPVDENCTERGINSFATLFTNEQRRNGAIIINFLVAIYMCGIIGYCCSQYFVPSLESICKELNLSPDVAGATFMAAGSSAPEFFSAFIGTFITEDDTGISAIVGSAAFNVFIITTFCCFFAGKDLKLTWWPLFRDCIVYVLSVLLLVVFMYDSIVTWWEGLILTSGYLFYIVLMCFNPMLSAKAIAWSERRQATSKNCETATTSLIGQNDTENKKNPYGTYTDLNKNQTESSFSGTPDTISSSVPSEQKLQDAPSSVFKFPQEWYLRTVWIIGLPTMICMFLTIPDCTKEFWRKWFMITFSMAIVWLMGASYILYWMITVIGYTLDIPDTVMGISILAAGTSVPDLIASILVVRHGYGDMAISNIIGSNVFEVFICLGLLWFIKSLFFYDVVISSDGLTFTTLSLLLTVAFIVIAIHFNGWKLNRAMGVTCLIVYIVFITLAILRELGMFGDIEPPTYCQGPK